MIERRKSSSVVYLGDRFNINGSTCEVVELQPNGDRASLVLLYPNGRRVTWSFRDLANQTKGMATWS